LTGLTLKKASELLRNKAASAVDLTPSVDTQIQPLIDTAKPAIN
jgi:hypothetical protein